MDDFLFDFNSTLEEAARRLRAAPEVRAARPMGGGWSAQQILGHLIDSAANNHQRFVRAQFTDHLDFPGYEQEQWVLAQHYEAEAWPRLLDLWLAYNHHLAHVVAGIPQQALSLQRTRRSLDRLLLPHETHDQNHHQSCQQKPYGNDDGGGRSIDRLAQFHDRA